jgi:CRP-like cAMP-binding protein
MKKDSTTVPTPPKHLTRLSKDKQTRKFLRGALKRNELFSGSTADQLNEMVDAFRRVEIKGKTTIIKQGHDQHAFFVVESGDLDVLVTEVQRTPTRNGMATRKVVRRTATLSKGNTFGERALMEERSSGSTFKTTGDTTVLWTIDKEDFNTEFLTSQSHLKRRESLNRIRKAVEGHPYFRHLQGEPGAQLNVIKNFFTVAFKKGETVVYEGSSGDNYYIVNKGTLNVYRRVDNVKTSLSSNDVVIDMITDNGKEYVKIKTLNPGDMFGELVLKFPKRVNEERIVATSDCQLYAMERSHFQQLARTGAHHLLDRFNRYASQIHPLAGKHGHIENERAMTIDDFFKCQLSNRWSEPANIIAPNTNPLVDSLDEGVLDGDGGATIGLLKLLFDLANTDVINDGCEHLLDFHDYYTLNVLMSKNHSEYEIAFRIMDTNRTGVITRSQLGIMLNTIAGYRGAGAMKRVSNDQYHTEIVKELMKDDSGPGKICLIYFSFIFLC